MASLGLCLIGAARWTQAMVWNVNLSTLRPLQPYEISLVVTVKCQNSSGWVQTWVQRRGYFEGFFGCKSRQINV